MDETPQEEMTLIFAYNADSGLFNLVADAVHKIVRPSTYPCKLCELSYAVTGMRRDWRQFVHSLGPPVRFLHRNELAAQYVIDDIELPAAFVVRDGETRLWIAAKDINACQSLADLMSLVTRKHAQLAAGIFEPIKEPQDP